MIPRPAMFEVPWLRCVWYLFNEACEKGERHGLMLSRCFEGFPLALFLVFWQFTRRYTNSTNILQTSNSSHVKSKAILVSCHVFLLCSFLVNCVSDGFMLLPIWWGCGCSSNGNSVGRYVTRRVVFDCP